LITNPNVMYNMERIKALISKLQEQLDQNSDVSAMMVTTQLLQVELQQAAQNNGRQHLGTAKVAVVLPISHQQPASISTPTTQHSEPGPAINESKKASAKSNHTQPAKKHDHIGWLFDTPQEIPTLAHQRDFQEVNDMMAKNGNAFSLNDQLKSHTMEVAAVLTDTPVRDLKKAIGINDRYVFINELFRGDETMYERSIKTINNFRIQAEADYWIERELKLKLGWQDTNITANHFCQLVKRRFAVM
jgi:type II secretory pathway pseudopilin PulG